MSDNIGANALVGGVLAAAILDALRTKNILSLDESRAVLTKAMNALGPSMQTPAGYDASQIIARLLRGDYSARK